MSWQEINPSGFKTWFYIIDRYGKTREAYVTTGSLLMNPLFTFFPKNQSFIRNVSSYLRDRMNEGISQNPAIGHDAGMHFAYYNPMSIKDGEVDISSKVSLEYFVGDRDYLFSIITTKYTAKLKVCTAELIRYFNRTKSKSVNDGKMAGDINYHPLNAFWETSPKQGLYKSYELQKELYNQKLAGNPKYQPFGAIDF